MRNPFRARRHQSRASVMSDYGRKRGRVREGIEYDEDAPGVRSLGAGGHDEDVDLNPSQMARSRSLSVKLYQRSPAYGAVVDRYIEHVIGDGILVEVEDDKVQKWLDERLSAPENRWDLLIAQRLRLLAIVGEMLPCLYGPARGNGVPTEHFTIGRLGLSGIKHVRGHPLNRDLARTLVYRHSTDSEDVAFPLVLNDDATPRDRYRSMSMADGKPPQLARVQFWRASTLGVRSGPLFSRILDKTSVLDRALENLADKVEYLNRFIFHATYKRSTSGDDLSPADEALEKKILKVLNSAEPGESLVTDESVKVAAVAPAFRAVDSTAVFEVLLEWVLGSHGIPRHWFGSGSDTARATAVEMGSPIYRSVASYQAYVRALVEDQLEAMLEWGQDSAAITVPKGMERRVVMSDVATRDSMRDAEEVARVLVFIEQAVRQRIISPQEAQAIGRAVIGSKHYGEVLEAKGPEVIELPDPAALDDAGEPPAGGVLPTQDPQERAEKGAQRRSIQAGLPVHRRQGRQTVGSGT